MAISQTTITGSIRRPDNSDAAVTEVLFTLSGVDFENGETIAINSVSAEVDTATGDFIISVWPNDAGLMGTTAYSVAFKFSDGSSIPALQQVYVRASSTDRRLDEIIAEAKIKPLLGPYDFRILTRAAYDGLTEKSATTFYLLRG